MAVLLLLVIAGIIFFAVSGGGNEPATKPSGSSTTPPATWTYAGHTVEQDDGTSFTNAVPAPVAHIDSLKGDCAALSGEVFHWTDYATANAGTDTAANALAYAQYAEDQRVAAGCP